jgi:hypothetical protein
MNYVYIKRWHVARAVGLRSGEPEVDTLCGRRVHIPWDRKRTGPLCLTCDRIGIRMGWPV